MINNAAGQEDPNEVEYAVGQQCQLLLQLLLQLLRANSGAGSALFIPLALQGAS